MAKFCECPLADEDARTIWDEMLSGRPYDAGYPKLAKILADTRLKIRQFNDCQPTETEKMRSLLSEILGGHGQNFHVNQPFRCDYGANIKVGENFFANFNLTILDEGPVEIGDNAFIGPNVSIYTACHPLLPNERNRLIEWAEGVTIGDNVWIGGSATLLPGAKIGDNCVIGAGSVVVGEIPANSIAVGNPARVLRKVQPSDSIYTS